MASFCLRNMVDLAIKNAVTLCSTNNTCIAECYRGYIFPSGNTKESYSCQNGNWTPLLSTCKRKFVELKKKVFELSTPRSVGIIYNLFLYNCMLNAFLKNRNIWVFSVFLLRCIVLWFCAFESMLSTQESTCSTQDTHKLIIIIKQRKVISCSVQKWTKEGNEY